MDNNETAQNLRIWDKDDALNRIMGQEAILKLLVEAFVKEMPVYASNLASALSRQDFEEAAKHAHGIKGGAGNLSTYAIAEKAKMIEDICLKGGVPGELDRLHEEFILALDQTISELKAWQEANA